MSAVKSFKNIYDGCRFFIREIDGKLVFSCSNPYGSKVKISSITRAHHLDRELPETVIPIDVFEEAMVLALQFISKHRRGLAKTEMQRLSEGADAKKDLDPSQLLQPSKHKFLRTVSKLTLYRWLATGKLWSIRIGKKFFTTDDAVRKFLRDCNSEWPDNAIDFKDDQEAEDGQESA